MPNQTSRYDDHTYGSTLYGAPPDGYVNANDDDPWAFGSIRVEGLDASEPLSPVAPGQEVTYVCHCRQDPNHPDSEHIQRAQALSRYLVYAPDVLVFDPPGQEVYYREQFDGPSALVRIAPLRADHDATWVDGDPPPGRDSIHYARWAVVTGGQFQATAGDDGVAVVELVTTTIAAADDAAEARSYSSRDAVLAAAERNGLS
jgi:hypothetical protein